ncbi:MAG: hypothetical protein KBB88_03635 [Candidatus Pacebacteria bacterium]|nr:hypothetical protein [Candidatus Paceibacterota bacterium]
MKKIIFLFVLGAIAFSTMMAQGQTKPETMYAAKFEGYPVKIVLPVIPFGESGDNTSEEREFALAAPLIPNVLGMIGDTKGQSSAIFKTTPQQQKEIFEVINDAADKQMVVVLFGVYLPALNQWNAKMFRKVKSEIDRKAFSDLQKYRWLEFSAYLVMTRADYEIWKKSVSGSSTSVTIER